MPLELILRFTLPRARGGGHAPAPTAAELDALRASVGWQRVHVDLAAGTLQKEHPAITLELSAIAPGYAADRIAAGLRALGFTRTLVDVRRFPASRHNPQFNQPTLKAVLAGNKITFTYGSKSVETKASAKDVFNYFVKDLADLDAIMVAVVRETDEWDVRGAPGIGVGQDIGEDADACRVSRQAAVDPGSAAAANCATSDGGSTSARLPRPGWSTPSLSTAMRSPIVSASVWSCVT